MFRPVQFATLVNTVPTDVRRLRESYSLFVAVDVGEAQAYTRSGLDWSEKFTGIVDAAAALKVRSSLIDGEAVVIDAQERSNYQALQGALEGRPCSIDYFAFDLPELDGEDLAACLAYFRLLEQGWTDALRTMHSGEAIYTFFDYFRNAYARNAELRIAHL